MRIASNHHAGSGSAIRAASGGMRHQLRAALLEGRLALAIWLEAIAVRLDAPDAGRFLAAALPRGRRTRSKVANPQKRIRLAL